MVCKASEAKRIMGTSSWVYKIISLFIYHLPFLDLKLRRAELLVQYHSNYVTITQDILTKILALKRHPEGRREVARMRFQRNRPKI